MSEANERSLANRQHLPWRMMSVPILLHAAYLVFASTSLVLWVAFALRKGYHKQGLAFTGAGVKLVELVWSAAAPVRYMLFPPTVSPREELLKKEDRGLNVPISPSWRKRSGRLPMSVAIEALIITVFDWMI